MSPHEKIAVGKKRVWPRKPYVPGSNPPNEFVGRDDELMMISAAWLSGMYDQPLSPLLVGPPGCGKNRLVYEMAKRMQLDLYVCQGYDNISAEELACSMIPADEGNGTIDFIMSALATAMLTGGICFIDEIGKFPGKALALLASVLDDRRYIDLDLIGERIHAHPRFRFIAATNSDDLETLPDFVRSRLFPVIRVERPKPEMINAIVSKQFPDQQAAVGRLLHLFWRSWDKHAAEDDTPSPRDVVQIFSLAIKLADYGLSTTNEWQSLPPTPQPISVDDRVGRAHLERALEQFLAQREMASC